MCSVAARIFAVVDDDTGRKNEVEIERGGTGLYCLTSMSGTGSVCVRTPRVSS